MKNIIRVLAVSSAVFTMNAAAEELDDIIVDLSDSAAESIDSDTFGLGLKKEPTKKKDASKMFYILPCCSVVDGKVEVMKPNSSTWEKVEEGRYYPLGSKYRTLGPESKLRLALGSNSEVVAEGDSSFGTLSAAVGEKKRGITLVSGTVSVKVPNNLPDGLLTVNAPGFVAYNPAGESKYIYTKTVDGDEVIVRCVTKSLSIKGRNFDIPSMRAANELRIRTSNDFLATSLYGNSGDILVTLDQGCVAQRDFTTGETKAEEKKLDWKLSPRTAVRIYRGKTSLGNNLSVTVLTFDARGQLKNRCAFTEHCMEINSGELGPASEEDRAELVKNAGNATKVEEVEAVDTEAVEAEATTTESVVE